MHALLIKVLLSEKTIPAMKVAVIYIPFPSNNLKYRDPEAENIRSFGHSVVHCIFLGHVTTKQGKTRKNY